MNTTIKAKNRILSLALAVCLLLGMTLYLPGPGPVRAELPPYGDDAEGEPWDGINFEALEGNGIYYGTYDHATNLSGATEGGQPKPVLWRVTGEEADSDNLTLLSEYVLDSSTFDNSFTHNKYADSDIIPKLSDMYADLFTNTTEKGYVVQTDVETKTYTWGTENYVGGYDSTATGQDLYIPWGTFINDSGKYYNNVFWTADSQIEDKYAIDRNVPDSLAESNATTFRSGGASVQYWLRSPLSGLSGHALSVNPAGRVGHDPVNYALGVRPAFQLNPSSVIFTSEIGLEASKGGTPIRPNIYSDAAGVGANFKLTILNTDVKLDSLSDTDSSLDGDGSETLTIVPGGTLDLTGTISNADNLVYKIVDRGTGGIVGYGMGTDTAITINGVANVTGAGNLSTTGNYTLYVWAQDNNDNHSHEGSQPMYFPLDVADALSTDATLASVAGKPITTGSDAGTINDPHTDSISLGYSVEKIEVGEIDPADTNATVKLYTDAGFSQNENQPMLLNPGDPTDLYIKVTAEDGSELYYKITATRDNAPLPGEHTVTVTPNPTGGGAPKATPTNAATGTQIALDANTATGYTFNHWESGSNGVTFTDDHAANTDFTMPDNDVTIVAHYTKDGAPQLGEPPAITTDSLPDGEVDKWYSEALTADGDTPITWTLDSGSLPLGLSLSDSGVIFGTPEKAETADFTVKAENSHGSDTEDLSITIAESGGGDNGNGNGGGSSGSRSSSRSSGGSSTPDSRVAKNQLPATAFHWDGERTLTIDHERITTLGLLSVQWDGKVLDRGTDYGVYQGSVIVRFDAAFIAAQAPGDHTVRVEFLNHTGETTITVGMTAATDEPTGHPDNDTHNPNTGGYPDGSYPGSTDNPNTGDNGGIWPALLLGSLGAAALALYRGERKPH